MNNANTWSAAPFISHDYNKGDEVERAEVKVVLGYGNVSKIEDSSKGQARKVYFTVSNSKYESSGWVQASEAPLVAMIEQAKEEGTPIYFRLETRRKADIARATPIDELTKLAVAKDSINKAIAALKWAEGDEWVFSNNAVTNPKEDPKTGGAGVHSALNMDFDEAPVKEKIIKTSAKGEPAPYLTHNYDGSINVGSIAVSVPLNLYAYVTDYERTHPEALPDLSDKQRTGLVKILLDISNKMQVAMYDGDESFLDLSSGSHTRARAILFELIRTEYPFTIDLVEDPAARKEWARSLYNRGIKMWEWSVNIIENQ